VAAEVNGQIITVEDLERRLGADRELTDEIAGLDEASVYQAKRSLLERMIADVLIEQEARRRGVAPDDLRASITRDVRVTDTEVEASYRMARDYKAPSPQLQRRVHRLLAGSEEEGRARIREFAQREKISVALRSFAIPLRQQATIVVHVKPPPGKGE